jgi:hypothetical protein
VGWQASATTVVSWRPANGLGHRQTKIGRESRIAGQPVDGPSDRRDLLESDVLARIGRRDRTRPGARCPRVDLRTDTVIRFPAVIYTSS